MTTSPGITPVPHEVLSIANIEKPEVIETRQPRTLMMSRRIGYGLLLMTFVDFLYVVLPPEFTNPVWEYKTIGDLIKLLPVPLLALMLIFYGETSFRSRLERFALRFLSWSTLLIGIVCLLLVPLMISDSVQIHRYNNTQITNQVSQQKLQLDATKKQLERATSKQLQSLIPLPDRQGNLKAPSNPEEAKTQILGNIDRAKDQAETQAAQARGSVAQNLVKNTVKLTLEALIAAFAFIYIWSMTSWARKWNAYGYDAPRPSSFNPIGRSLHRFQRSFRPDRTLHQMQRSINQFQKSLNRRKR